MNWSGFDANTSTLDVPVLVEANTVGDAVDVAEEGRYAGAKLSKGLVFSYGLGHVLNDLCASMWFFYAVLYCQQVLGIDSDMTGVIVLIGQVVDGLTTPVVGYASDRTRTYFGARKPWHFFGAVCVALTFPFVFGGCFIGATPTNFLSGACLLKPWQDTKGKMALLIGFISLFQIGWASSQVSHLALMPDISHNKKQRTTLSSVRYGVTVACNICILLMLSILLARENKSDSSSTTTTTMGVEKSECDGVQLTRADQPLFQSLSWMVTLIGSLCACGFWFGIPNHPKRTRRASEDANNLFSSTGSLSASSLSIFEDALFWKHGLLYMLSRLMINLNMVYMPLYVQSTMRMRRADIAIIPLLMYVLSLLGSFIQNLLNEKFGRVAAFSIGGALQVVGSLSLLLLPSHLSVLMYVIAPLIGLAGTSMLVTVISMTSDFIGKRNLSAKVFGLYSFSDKVCSGIAVYWIQASLTCGDCCMNGRCCSKFYRKVLGIVPLGAAVLSFAIILLWRQMKIRRLKREESTLLLDPTASISDRKAYSYGAMGESDHNGGGGRSIMEG